MSKELSNKMKTLNKNLSISIINISIPFCDEVVFQFEKNNTQDANTLLNYLKNDLKKNAFIETELNFPFVVLTA